MPDAHVKDGATVHVYDPKVTREAALEEFSLHGFEVSDRQLVWSPSAEESVKDAHAIAVLTEWERVQVLRLQEVLWRHGEACRHLRRSKPFGPVSA